MRRNHNMVAHKLTQILWPLMHSHISTFKWFFSNLFPEKFLYSEFIFQKKNYYLEGGIKFSYIVSVINSEQQTHWNQNHNLIPPSHPEPLVTIPVTGRFFFVGRPNNSLFSPLSYFFFWVLLLAKRSSCFCFSQKMYLRRSYCGVFPSFSVLFEIVCMKLSFRQNEWRVTPVLA